MQLRLDRISHRSHKVFFVVWLLISPLPSYASQWVALPGGVTEGVEFQIDRESIRVVDGLVRYWHRMIINDGGSRFVAAMTSFAVNCAERSTAGTSVEMFTPDGHSKMKKVYQRREWKFQEAMPDSKQMETIDLVCVASAR